MVLVYLGMAYLLAVNFFDWATTPAMNAFRWGAAAIFAAYGLYRGYRQVSGKDYYRLQRTDNEDDGATYGPYPHDDNNNSSTPQ